MDVIVAELAICHSRPMAPTRRIALGVQNLPTQYPYYGALLLAAIAAENYRCISADLCEELDDVLASYVAGHKVSQPIVRHRFQVDRVGLLSANQRIHKHKDSLRFELNNGSALPEQLVLGAILAAQSLPLESRGVAFRSMKKARTWNQNVDASFTSYIVEGFLASAQVAGSRSWALETLAFNPFNGTSPSKRIVKKRFRSLLRKAHPDHGGLDNSAATRIEELTEARNILLDTPVAKHHSEAV